MSKKKHMKEQEELKQKAAEEVQQAQTAETEAENAEATDKAGTADNTAEQTDTTDKKAEGATEGAEGTNEGAEAAEEPKEKTVEEKLADAEKEIEELKTKALYKQAEFENFRKRQMTEKADLILNGGRKVLEAMLPVMDDLERALAHMDKAEDVAAVKEGVELIQKKFLQVLKAQGVTQMDTANADFNTDFHEAVTQFPAPTEELKGKVIDCTEKGYMINDKVLRFAKVVVGI